MSDADSARAYLTGALTGGPRPVAVGRKFAPDGGVLPTAGNTMICHIDPGSEAHAALVAAQAMLRTGPCAGAFAFLPPASFHMTVFEGVIDTHRTPGHWPADRPVDAPVDAVTTDFLGRVPGVALPPGFDIRPDAVFGGFSVRVSGATVADAAALRGARDSLAQALGLRRADHHAYGFHITLGYLLRWLTPAEASAVIALSHATHRALAARAPVIRLGAVEFCTFADMHRFDCLRRLG